MFERTYLYGEHLLGYASVDSGQLMITDPGYVDDYWRDEHFVPPTKKYTLNDAGKAQYPDAGDWSWTWGPEQMKELPYGGPNYGTPLPELDGASVGDLMVQNLVEEEVTLPDPATPFSYNDACQKTLTLERAGEVKIGGATGVVFSSGYGDGTYPVWGTYEDGRIVEVRIDMR